jgi:DNA-directed RNA polymerase specialized sigma24 family protein
MSNGYVIPIDPAELSNRFAAPDAEEPEDENEEGLDGDHDAEVANFLVGADYESRIAPLLNRIPQREADLIYLYYIQKKRQADIAEIFGVTQAAISYRLDRGLQRIKFLLSIPQASEDELREDLAELFEPIDVNILVGMWQTTCQSEVANRLGLTQGRVRHRFFKSIETLKKREEEDARFEPYHRIFAAISNKKGPGGFNILREVKLPQWANRGGDQCF